MVAEFIGAGSRKPDCFSPPMKAGLPTGKQLTAYVNELPGKGIQISRPLPVRTDAPVLDVRCSMLDVRCSMLDVRCSMLDVGSWALGLGPWALGVSHFSLQPSALFCGGARRRRAPTFPHPPIRCWMLDVGYSPSNVVVGRVPPHGVRCWMFPALPNLPLLCVSQLKHPHVPIRHPLRFKADPADF